MLDQLRARGAVHRISEVAYLGSAHEPTDTLRVMLVEHGIWSPREVLDSLEAVDYQARAGALWALAPILPDEYLSRALDIAQQRSWGDDARWRAYEKLVEMLAERAADAGKHERDPKNIHALDLESKNNRQIQTPKSAADALADFLFGAGARGSDLWTEPCWKGLLSYIARVRYVDSGNRWRQGFALVAALARDRANPQSRVLRSALLNSGHWLWREPWFNTVFDAQERREHLEHLVAERESTRVPWDDCFEGLLQIAEQLHGACRSTVVRWAVARREERGGTAVPVDLARAAALAQGPERDATVAKIEPRFEELDTSRRLSIVIALMRGASSMEAITLARRGLQILASGGATVQDASALLASIPPRSWFELDRLDWEPALQAGSFLPNGWASHLRWAPYDLRLIAVPNLPREIRDVIEERGLPDLLRHCDSDSLWIGAQAIHALSSAGRARLAAWALALDADTWRKARSAVGPIACALDDDDLERLCCILQEPNPKGEWQEPESNGGGPEPGLKEEWDAERGLAEAWAARGTLDRATAFVKRITDDEIRAQAEAALAMAAADVAALRPQLDAEHVYFTLKRPTYRELVRWTPQERGPAFADALAARLSENSAAWARLEVWAALWPALSASMQAELGPRIERAVDVVLAEDDRCDDSLCAIADLLPERLLERIWIARASASGYRHALALYEKRFCEFMLAGNYHHSSVLLFMRRLGSDEALLEHAKWLAGIDVGAGPGGLDNFVAGP